ncbi:MAG TPA: ATP-binding protein [Gemmatimonadaceae bacterium]
MVVDAEYSAGGSFERYIEHVPAAFALTLGRQHTLVYANAAFRSLVTPDGEPSLGSPIAGAFARLDTAGLTALLDRAFRTGIVSRNRRIASADESVPPLSCTVWPDVNRNGESEHLVIELRPATQRELTLGLQREMAERLLLNAVRQQDAADVAEVSRRGAAFLASESRRLVESLDERATLVAMERMSLPYLGAWCIVDTLDDDDTMHRLAIIHPDSAKQTILEELEGRWIPDLDDEFGLPAALRSATPTVIADKVDAVLANAAHDPKIAGALRALGVGPLLTVPLVVRERLIGAVTFVGERHDRPFTPNDLEMAKDLASRSAMALDRARLYGEAIALKIRAESASEAKSAFLGMMSHELRTPLNAIGGYVDLMDMEIHGPVTEAQHVDLARIRSNQRYLMGLITDLLNLTKVSSGQLVYNIDDIVPRELLATSTALVEPLIAQKLLIYDGIACDAKIVARGDPEKVTQILVNLLSNAIKFTPPGGRLAIDCEATQDAVLIRVSDTGIGIPPEKLKVIFEPFVQVKGSSLGPESGIGLGLAISRGLAQAMHGDLSVESTLGAGARFTLTLPRASLALRSAAPTDTL